MMDNDRFIAPRLTGSSQDRASSDRRAFELGLTSILALVAITWPFMLDQVSQSPVNNILPAPLLHLSITSQPSVPSEPRDIKKAKPSDSEIGRQEINKSKTNSAKKSSSPKTDNPPPLQIPSAAEMISTYTRQHASRQHFDSSRTTRDNQRRNSGATVIFDSRLEWDIAEAENKKQSQKKRRQKKENQYTEQFDTAGNLHVNNNGCRASVREIKGFGKLWYLEGCNPPSEIQLDYQTADKIYPSFE